MSSDGASRRRGSARRSDQARGGGRRERGAPSSRGRSRGGPPRGGQTSAVNRSRPVYDDTRASRRGGRAGDSRNGPERDDRLPAPLPSNPREAALRILHAVETRGAFSDRLLDGAHSRGPDERSIGLLHELVKGTLRWRGRIDYVLDARVHIGLTQLQPWVRNVLRLGAYQLMFLDRVPAHAAVDESVKLAHKYGHPGTAGLVNSVLRRLVEEKDGIALPEGDSADALSVSGSHPRWMVERWLARFGPDATRALLEANNRPVPVGLRANRLRVTREELVDTLASAGIEALPAALAPELVWLKDAGSPATLKVFQDGWCTAQDESECLVSHLVGPEPNDRVLDLCAAPGGKSSHLAELIDDEGEVWALEKTETRVASLRQTIERLGMHCVHVVHGDGMTYEFPMPFDRVLVDAPCSGFGVLGRRADARWRKGPEIIRQMSKVQHDLLAAGGRRARPGGVLVYSVCSFEPEETVDVVERFLRSNRSFVLESASGLLPGDAVDEQGFMTVLPHVHGCDGAFAARFRKT